MAFKVVLKELPEDLIPLVIGRQAELKIEKGRNVSLEETIFVLLREHPNMSLHVCQ